MLPRKLKGQVFRLVWLNIYAIAFYFDFLFFVMRDRYGFSNRENLLLAALNGFLYVIASWLGGKFAQKRGYLLALKLGFGTAILALAAGACLDSAPAQIGVLVLWTFGSCFTWPSLEALVSENEDRPGLSRMIGIYNLTWAGGAALAYFSGGALLQQFGFRSLFIVPALLHGIQILLIVRLENALKTFQGTPVLSTLPVRAEPISHPVQVAISRTFLLIAWIANPFAYIAMNTVIPLLPDVAAKLGLSTELAGFVGSVWMFARLAAFVVLWRWQAWHYQIKWMVWAFVLMIGSFVALLLASHLVYLVLAEILFGLAVGLIYYSSLFYSMDVGETKGEHGGFHEALIGVGLFAGPAFGAGSISLFPRASHAGLWGVSGLLVIGFCGLLWIYVTRKKHYAK